MARSLTAVTAFLTLGALTAHAQVVVGDPVYSTLTTPSHTVKHSIYSFGAQAWVFDKLSDYNTEAEARAVVNFLKYFFFYTEIDCKDMPPSAGYVCMQPYSPDTKLPPGFYYRPLPPGYQPCPPICQPCPPVKCERPRLFARLRCR